jgi:hypothetical protein
MKPQIQNVARYRLTGARSSADGVLPCPTTRARRKVSALRAGGVPPRTDQLARSSRRQLNYALHVMAMAQIKQATPGRDYYQRKRAAGKTHKEAMRCLKRRLADVVYRTMIYDTETSLPPTP